MFCVQGGYSARCSSEAGRMGNRESRRWGPARMAARGARVVWASVQMGRHPSGRRRWGRGDGRTSTPSRIPRPRRRRRLRWEIINRRTIWTLGSGLRGGKGRHPRRAGRSRSRRLRRRTYRRSSGASTSTTCWTASSTDEISERSRRDSCECNFCPEAIETARSRRRP